MRKLLLLISLCFLTLQAKAQGVSLTGYVKDMQGVYYLENAIHLSNGNSLQWTTYNQLNNRVNIDWEITEPFHINVGLRNRIFFGKMLGSIPEYIDLFEKDKGFLDLSINLIEGNKWFLNSSLDRLYIDYTIGKCQLKAGRQRINWGIDLIWNPNDLFNAFSYIDFDYQERSGSDAILFTWYTSDNSSLDIACKVDHNKESTIAARYLFNIKDYDIQFIAGKYMKDLAAGMGWSGNIGPLSFRGEGTVFTPYNNDNTDSSGTSAAFTFSFDYTTKSSLYLQTAFLFNSGGTRKQTTGISLLDPDRNLDAKHLSLGKYEIFGQISYPVNPVLTLGISGMYNPSDNSCYIGPSLTLSLGDNFDFMLDSQLLIGNEGSEYGTYGKTFAGFGRVKWSF
ncbi:MAG: hypothetical protein M0R37_04670 [Bacteroidales bacterium]|nr:hypothetical protein [Bacteroidales bacterium]